MGQRQEDRPGWRTERDWLGAVDVPADALWGIHTERAMSDFALSGRPASRALVRGIVRVKAAAARVHAANGQLAPRHADAVAQACAEVLAGRLDDAFRVDAFQSGAGTALHMNVNEVLANRANQLLGSPLGSYSPLDPHDDLNRSQSTNDVLPTALRLAVLEVAPALEEALKELEAEFSTHAAAWGGIVKAGRTHLQDALPLSFGREVGAWAVVVGEGRRVLARAMRPMRELGIGGSAVGSGLNTPAGWREAVVRELARATGQPLRPAPDTYAAMQSLGPFGVVSGALRGLVLELSRIMNDLRLLASGPRAGLAELGLPAVQAGSSIMPGKVNPSVPEAVNQVCMYVQGLDHTVALAVQAGQLELNVMLPVVAASLLDAFALLTPTVHLLSRRCVRGMTPNAERAEAGARASLALVTVLNPVIGYEAAAALFRQALETGRSLHDVVSEAGVLTAEQAAALLDPHRAASGASSPTTEPPAPRGDGGQPASE